MQVTPLLGSLRILGGLGLVIGVGLFGYYGRSVWVLPVLAVIFTLSFGLGRWRAWRHAAASGSLGAAMLAQLGTVTLQLILCGVFFLIGRGIASLSGGVISVPFEALDWIWLACFAGYAIALGMAVMVLEHSASSVDLVPHGAHDDAFPKIDPTPLTDATFWASPHYLNQDNVYDDAKDTTLNKARAFLSDAAITAEETRLGISLPPRLRRLFALQNGGSGMGLWVPCADDRTNAENGWIAPFSGYDDLIPLTKLDTLQEAIEAYAYLDETDRFPIGSDKIIVLAQWYSETLFLDYRADGPPRVGFLDFDGLEPLNTPDWEAKALWWSDFDSFFAELRREVE